MNDKQKEKLRKDIVKESFIDDKGVRRWKKSKKVVPPCVYNDADMSCPDFQIEAYYKEAEEKIAEYKERMKNYKYSEEELNEMRAAFGEGTEVINIITGKKIKL